VDAVTRADDFFDLGAHSLLITHILNRVHKEFEIDLTMRDFLDAAKFGDFCTLIAQKLRLATIPVPPATPPARAA
jgi:acyl carrier protein